MLTNKDALRKVLNFLLDMICVFASFLMNLAAFSDPGSIGSLIVDNRLGIAVFLMTLAFMLIIFKCYEEPVREYSMTSAVKLGGALIISHIVFILLLYIMGEAPPPLFVLNQIIYSIFICGIYRLLIVLNLRIGLEFLKREHVDDVKRVIIVGAGDAGKYLADMLNYDKSKKCVRLRSSMTMQILRAKRSRVCLLWGLVS